MPLIQTNRGVIALHDVEPNPIGAHTGGPVQDGFYQAVGCSGSSQVGMEPHRHEVDQSGLGLVGNPCCEAFRDGRLLEQESGAGREPSGPFGGRATKLALQSRPEGCRGIRECLNSELPQSG